MRIKVNLKVNDFFKRVVIYLPLLIFLLCSSCSKDDVNPNSGPVDTNQYKVLILMYHDLAAGVPENIYVRNTTDFENDLTYIKSKNYQVISFDDLIKIKNREMKLTSDAIIISFDDGYLCNYTIAYPILKIYKFPATFFVVTEWVGDADRISWSNAFEMDRYRTTEGKKLISIESHSSSHPFLLTDSGTFANHDAYQASLNAEIGDSKNWIQGVTGQQSMWLALPYGDGAKDPGIINTAINYGYSGIRTSMYGAFTIKDMDLFALPSLPVLSTTNITDIENYLN